MSDRLQFPIRSDKLSMNAHVVRRLFQERSQFQLIEIVETEAFGKLLMLDGHIQLTALDEFAYHEALVQIPLLNITEPSTALIVGGGDGGVLREIARWNSITSVDMVEIDEKVVRACAAHWPELSHGAFDDPRVKMHYEDAFGFVKRQTQPYDLIVVDCTDVYEEEEGELSERLFSDEFYSDCRRLLSEKGFVVTQADNLVFCPYSLQAVSEMFSRVFPAEGSYWAVVPSFGGFSGFCWGSLGAKISPVIPRELPSGVRYLSPVTYALAFSPLPFQSS
jgi:spermidine synthase